MCSAGQEQQGQDGRGARRRVEYQQCTCLKLVLFFRRCYQAVGVDDWKDQNTPEAMPVMARGIGETVTTIQWKKITW